MAITVHIKNRGNIKLKDSDYVSSGGEAEVYAKDWDAFKIYHDPNKMISDKKMDELANLSSRDNIIVPQETIYDEKMKRIGFTMRRLHQTEPLCKFFTNSFKSRNSITDSTLNGLVERMQDTLSFIHKKDALVVDLNELNLLVPNKFDDVYFIDVDSYQTVSNRATAIMASIRDPLVKSNDWTEGSDWYSFAILAFQMWIGIHPYKGGHPSYKKKDWLQRMQDGVSVFDPLATLPKMCNALSDIPPSHYQWLKAVFQDGLRSEPPQLGDISITISTAFNITETSNDFDIELNFTSESDIIDVFDVMGVKYIIAHDGIYKEKAKLIFDVNSTKTLLTNGTGITPIVASLKDEMIAFRNIGGSKFAEMASTEMMTSNGVIYSVSNSSLYEHNFRNRDGKDLHGFRLACNIMPNSVKMFDGILFQSMMKKQHAVIPYEIGKCAIVKIGELDDYRVIDAKYDRNICVVLTEKKGQYDRFVFYFEKGCMKYTFRKEEDVVVSEVNFTVMPNGVAILATEADVEIFKGEAVKKIDNSPFDASNKLFNIAGAVHYIEGNKIYKASIKK